MSLAMIGIIARIALRIVGCARSNQWLATVLAVAVIAQMSRRSMSWLRSAPSVVGQPRGRSHPLPSPAEPSMTLGGDASFNEVSLLMLRTVFDDRPRSVIAMGDRAGGLPY